MVVLDTDHVSFLDRGSGTAGQRLQERLDRLPQEQVVTTIVTYEEQMRGWMGYMGRARTLVQQVEGYRRLMSHLESFRAIRVLGFDEVAAVEFRRLHHQVRRVGTMDLKIAAVAISVNATLLSRNLRDFRRVPGLRVEDWSL